MRVLNAFSRFLNLSQFCCVTFLKLMERRCLRHHFDQERSQNANLRILETKNSYQMRTSGFGMLTMQSVVTLRNQSNHSMNTLKPSLASKKKTNLTLTVSLRVLMKVRTLLLLKLSRKTSWATAKKKNAYVIPSPNLWTCLSSKLTVKTSETCTLANTQTSLRRKLSWLLKKQRKRTISFPLSSMRSMRELDVLPRTLRSSLRPRNTSLKFLSLLPNWRMKSISAWMSTTF